MSQDFLSCLDVDAQTQAKLRRLGTQSPAALLSRIDYSFDQLAKYVGGTPKLDSIRQKLQSMIPAQEAGPPISTGSPHEFARGALLPPRAEPAEEMAALAKRDELMQRIRQIRAAGGSGRPAQQELESLQSQLSGILSATVRNR